MFRVRTTYVKRLITQTPWERRHEVEDLVLLERIILGETRNAGWAWNAYVRPEIIKRLYTHYVAIRDELEPGWREREEQKTSRELAQRRRAYMRDLDARARQRRERFEQMLHAWRNAGYRLEPPPEYEPLPEEGLSAEQIEARHRARGLAPPWEDL